MTRDEINRLIQDNELFHGTVSIGVIMDINHLERLVDLVTAAERAEIERLKLLCEEMLRELYVYRASEYLKDVTAAIRARGQA